MHVYVPADAGPGAILSTGTARTPRQSPRVRAVRRRASTPTGLGRALPNQVVRVRLDELVATLQRKLDDRPDARMVTERVGRVERAGPRRDEWLVDVLEVASYLGVVVRAVDEGEGECAAQGVIVPEEVAPSLARAPGREELVRGKLERMRQSVCAPEANVALELLAHVRAQRLRGRHRLRPSVLEYPRVGRDDRVRSAVLAQEVRQRVRRLAAEGADLEHGIVAWQLADRDIEQVRLAPIEKAGGRLVHESEVGVVVRDRWRPAASTMQTTSDSLSLSAPAHDVPIVNPPHGVSRRECTITCVMSSWSPALLRRTPRSRPPGRRAHRSAAPPACASRRRRPAVRPDRRRRSARSARSP